MTLWIIIKLELKLYVTTSGTVPSHNTYTIRQYITVLRLRPAFPTSSVSKHPSNMDNNNVVVPQFVPTLLDILMIIRNLLSSAITLLKAQDNRQSSTSMNTSMKNKRACRRRCTRSFDPYFNSDRPPHSYVPSTSSDDGEDIEDPPVSENYDTCGYSDIPYEFNASAESPNC